MNTSELTPQIQVSFTETVNKVQPLAIAAWEFHTALAKLVWLSLRYVDLKARDQIEAKWPVVQEQVQTWWNTYLVPAQADISEASAVELTEVSDSEVSVIGLAALVVQAEADVKNLTSEFVEETEQPKTAINEAPLNDLATEAPAIETAESLATEPLHNDQGSETEGDESEALSLTAIAMSEEPANTADHPSELETLPAKFQIQGAETSDRDQELAPALETESSLSTSRKWNKRSNRLSPVGS